MKRRGAYIRSWKNFSFWWITIPQNRAINQPIVIASAKNIRIGTQLCLAHHYLGRIAPNLNKPAGMLILTEVEMELQDVSGPIKDLTMDRLRFHEQNG